MKSWNLRFVAIGTGALVLAMFALCGGGQKQSPGYILIDFANDPDLFRGLAVEIDGQTVGKLEPMGDKAVSAFGVGYGTHEVCLLHPAIGCRPATVELEHPGQRAYLLLQIGDWGDGTEFFFDQ